MLLIDPMPEKLMNILPFIMPFVVFGGLLLIDIFGILAVATYILAHAFSGVMISMIAGIILHFYIKKSDNKHEMDRLLDRFHESIMEALIEITQIYSITAVISFDLTDKEFSKEFNKMWANRDRGIMKFILGNLRYKRLFLDAREWGEATSAITAGLQGYEDHVKAEAIEQYKILKELNNKSGLKNDEKILEITAKITNAGQTEMEEFIETVRMVYDPAYKELGVDPYVIMDYYIQKMYSHREALEKKVAKQKKELN